MRGLSWRRVVSITGLLLFGVSVSGTGSRFRLDLTTLLDGYGAGRFDETLRTFENAGDDAGRQLRLEWPVAGRKWVDRAPEDRHRRLLVAASLLIETENVRIERGDWSFSDSDVCEVLIQFGSEGRGNPTQCLINWAYALLLERGFPDEAERAWILATTAMLEGVRDWRFLRIPPSATPPRPSPGRQQVRGLIDRSLDRFPDDPVLRFHAGLADVSRYNVTVDGGRATTDPFAVTRTIITSPTVIRLTPPGEGAAGSAGTTPARDEPLALLVSLRDDPILGPEARLRLGYAYWALDRDLDARAELQTAIATANDSDLKYLARFLLGWFALQGGAVEDARRELTAALEVRPHSQSAALALAALELQAGEAARTYDIAEASLAERRTDDDPWRLFLYGHHPHLAALLADLRKKTR